MTTISSCGKADGIIMSPKQRDNTTPRIDIGVILMEHLCFYGYFMRKQGYRENFRKDEADFGVKLRKRIFFAGVIINQTSG
jgi:hypothetical protein